MKTLLWLDDYRNPYKMDSDWVRVFSPIGANCTIFWVKSYKQFCEFVSNRRTLPDAICFDHDLGDVDTNNPNYEKTGYDCAKFLVEYCQDKNLPLPLWNCQSANPSGRDNINGILNNYKQFYEGTLDKKRD